MRLIILFIQIALCEMLYCQNSKPKTMADTFPCNSWKKTKTVVDGVTYLKNDCRFNVLANDADPDGDRMKVMRFNGRVVNGIDSILLKDTGVVYLSEGGNFMVRCNPSFIGTITLTYTVNDGQFILGIWKGKSGAPSKGTIIYRKEW